MNKSAFFFAISLIAGNPYSESNDELKNRLEQALKTINDLQTRVNTLERKQSTIGTTVVGNSSTEVKAPVIAPNNTAPAGTANAGNARIELTGQVMFDAIYDFKRVDPDWTATLRPSKIPVYCPDNGDPRDAGCGEDGETIMSVRQSKFGLKGFFPTTLGELTTILDFDLFDSDGGSTIRVLNAWGEIGSFGAGQYYTLFMDIDTFPNTIDYWGPNGMVFVRNPQMRYTPYNNNGIKVAFSLEAPGSALDTGKVTDELELAGVSINSRNEMPDIIGNFRLDRDWGHLQAAAMYRKLSFDTPSLPGAEPSNSEDGYGVNLSGVINTFGADRITAQFAIGDGIASYMNDGGNDLAPNSDLRAEAVQSIGWFIYYDHSWNDQWTSSIGYSEHTQDTTGGQSPDAFEKGSYSSLNLLYYPVKNMTVGAELMWGRRENKDGNAGEDSRMQFSSKFVF